MKQGYCVDFEEREIIVTKKFLKAAEQMNTAEFEIMLKLTKQLPNFRVRRKISCRKYSCMDIE